VQSDFEIVREAGKEKSNQADATLGAAVVLMDLQMPVLDGVSREPLPEGGATRLPCHRPDHLR